MAGLVLLGGMVGCQSPGRIFYRPRAMEAESGHVYLAAETTTAPAATTQPASAGVATTQPAKTEEASDGAATTRPGVRYAQPRSTVRKMVFSALVSQLAVEDATTGAGREFSQSQSPQVGQIAGRSGLTAPQPVTATTLASRPGVVTSVTAQIPRADESNLTTPGLNPISRFCSEFVKAGFSRDHSFCAQHSAARYRR